MNNSVKDPCRVAVLSGPSGSGKTTIVGRILSDSAVPIQMAVSATTRPPRQNEVDGTHYYFLSSDEFQARRDAGDFVECAEVHRSGFWYGTLKSEVQRIQDSGSWVLLEIDVEGALQVMQIYPDATSLFLMTPSVDEYERRLRSRGTESEEVIQRRLRTAAEELKSADSYRHHIINDDLDRAVQEICDVLEAREKDFYAR
ncbi:guanylate kinase [Thalassoglobus polymorphus]|uniref:Guanylate kinase n=1 Tax=Thalassoglobus polymorphus TaxID=2527994 RepID=A0A517QTD8_9PLAN|nr:guanylate kinase [Thalassoglobus polymorphus]QDT34848.1 Guanylate kinase [Thalassoglobus polymorphus]